MPRSKLLCLFRDLVSIFKDIYISKHYVYLLRVHKACSQYHIFQYSSRKKKKHFKFLLFNLCFPFINKNDSQKKWIQQSVLLHNKQRNITRWGRNKETKDWRRSSVKQAPWKPDTSTVISSADENPWTNCFREFRSQLPAPIPFQFH